MKILKVKFNSQTVQAILEARKDIILKLLYELKMVN